MSGPMLVSFPDHSINDTETVYWLASSTRCASTKGWPGWVGLGGWLHTV